jgi:DNA-binding GntR family transcriptional regulator
VSTAQEIGNGLEEGGSGTPASLLSESAYELLRSRLVKVEIMPGTRLNESDLKASLGLGASPVREAIRRLEFERLVAIYPRSGTFATDIALKDSRSVTEFRIEMEALAATLASKRGSKAEKDRLVELAESQYQTSDLQKCIDLDAAFHRSMYRMTRNDYLADTLDIYFNLALRQWYFCSQVVQTPDWTGVDHRPLAAAIAAQDVEAAARHIRDHVRHDSEQILGILTAYGL